MCSIMGYCGRGADLAAFQKGFDRTLSRGPDDSRIVDVGGGILAFHRLAIMGLTAGRECSPLSWTAAMLVCNGELYGFRPMKTAAGGKWLHLPKRQRLRNPAAPVPGVRHGHVRHAGRGVCPASSTTARPASSSPPGTPSASGPCTTATTERAPSSLPASPRTWWASARKIMPFPPGHYYQGRRIPSATGTSPQWNRSATDDLDTVCRNIRDKLIAGVEKRLDAGRPGGLPALRRAGLLPGVRHRRQATEQKPIRHLCHRHGRGRHRPEIRPAGGGIYRQPTTPRSIMTREEVLDALRRGHRSCWAPTTSPPSGPAWACTWCCKAIHEHTDVRVLLTGEISDELFGYKYTDFAPSARGLPGGGRKAGAVSSTCTMCSGRTGASPSTPWRPGCPSAIWTSCDYVMAMDPARKLNTYGKGKYLLRQAFDEGDYLPHDHPLAGEGRLLRRGGPLHGGLPEGVRREPVHATRSLQAGAPQIQTTPAPSPRSPCCTGRSLRSITPARPRWSRTSGCQTGAGRAAM